MADITIVGEKKQESVIDKQPEQISAPVRPEVIRSSVEQAMGLESQEDMHRYQDKVDILVEYTKSQTKDWSPESIKWVIRSLEMKLGTPPFSEKRINYVAQYAYLMMEKRKLDSDIKSFELA